jgi:hypothetical protein
VDESGAYRALVHPNRMAKSDAIEMENRIQYEPVIKEKMQNLIRL